MPTSLPALERVLIDGEPQSLVSGMLNLLLMQLESYLSQAASSPPASSATARIRINWRIVVPLFACCRKSIGQASRVLRDAALRAAPQHEVLSFCRKELTSS